MNIPEWVPQILKGAGYFIVILIILVGLGALVVGVPSFFGPVPIGEIQMGLVVALAISSLLGLLTVMAAVYSNLMLTDRRQALGLPEGSIRALIALFLIMMFIIMSVYLFRTIAGREGIPLTNLTAEQVAELEGRIQILDIEQNNSGTFDVIPKVGVTPAAEQLALQLVTILGTLVTAVSAFYFGSATTKSAPGDSLK